MSEFIESITETQEEEFLRLDIERLAELQHRVAEMNEEVALIKSRLRELGPGTHETSIMGVSVKVSPALRFDPDEAKRLLPAETLAAITVPTVSATLAREILAPALYKALSKPHGEARVTVMA